MTDPFLDGIMRRIKVREQMTDTKPSNPTGPTVEELERICSINADGVVSLSLDSAKIILASLRHYQSIRSAEMPVEPEVFYIDDGNDEFVKKSDYDALTAYSLKEKERADRAADMAQSNYEMYKKAESERAAIRGDK